MENKIQETYWCELIKCLKIRGKISTGLTIPYLIGAKCLLEGKNVGNDGSIELLVEQIRWSQTDKIAFFQECRDIRQYVIGLVERDHPYVKIGHTFDNLVVTADAQIFGNSLKEIKAKMNVFWLEPIKKGRFSWNREEKDWEEFNSEEKKQIWACFNSNKI